MTLTIPLSHETETRLRQQAAALGKDVAAFVRETVEEKLASLPKRDLTPSERASAWDRWVAHMRDWVEKNVPPGHTLDDSRESIYEGRGE